MFALVVEVVGDSAELDLLDELVLAFFGDVFRVADCGNKLEVSRKLGIRAPFERLCNKVLLAGLETEAAVLDILLG